jgi:hypothetical protein
VSNVARAAQNFIRLRWRHLVRNYLVMDKRSNDWVPRGGLDDSRLWIGGLPDLPAGAILRRAHVARIANAVAKSDPDRDSRDITSLTAGWQRDVKGWLNKSHTASPDKIRRFCVALDRGWIPGLISAGYMQHGVVLLHALLNETSRFVDSAGFLWLWMFRSTWMANSDLDEIDKLDAYVALRDIVDPPILPQNLNVVPTASARFYATLENVRAHLWSGRMLTSPQMVNGMPTAMRAAYRLFDLSDFTYTKATEAGRWPDQHVMKAAASLTISWLRTLGSIDPSNPSEMLELLRIKVRHEKATRTR